MVEPQEDGPATSAPSEPARRSCVAEPREIVLQRERMPANRLRVRHGDVIALGNYSHIYCDAERIEWEIRRNVLEINGRVAGVNLLDGEGALTLTPDELEEHRGRISTIKITLRGDLTTEILDAIDQLASDELMLQIFVLSSSPEAISSLAGLARLGDRLRGLSLSGHVSAEALASLAQLPALWVLDAPERLVGADLRHIAPLTQLRVLDLLNTDLTDEDLRALAPLTQLRRLVIHGDLSGRGFVHLGCAQTLESLRLSGDDVDDEGVAALEGYTALRHLNLGATSVTRASFGVISGLPELRTLVLAGARGVDEYGLDQLANLPHLRELDLGYTRVTHAGLHRFAFYPALRVLDLGETEEMDGEGLRDLARISTLRELRLDRAEITDAGLVHLAELSGLESLSLRTTALTDAGMEHIARMTSLEVLAITHTGVGDAGLATLGALPSLRFLDVRNTDVTMAAVETFRRQHPGCVARH